MNSDTFKFNFPKVRILYLLIAGSFILAPSLAKAQMFSVKNAHQTRMDIPHYHIYAGVGPSHFTYRPNDRDNFYAFNGEIAHLALKAYNFKLFLGKGIGLGHISFLEIGVQGGYELEAYQSQRVRLQVPLQLRAGITTVTNDNLAIRNTSSFREGTISIRTGIDFKARISPTFRLGLGVIPHIGLAYSTGRYDGGGTVLGAAGSIHLFFDHLFGRAGLSLGYSYDFRKFNVKGNLLDYNAVENGFLIGVTF